MSATLKRTTFVVADADASARFFAEVFGLTEWYRNEFAVDGRFPPAAPDGTRAHLIVLKAEDPAIGMLGFLSYLADAPAPAGPVAPTVRMNQPILAFSCDDITALAERARAAGALSVTGPGVWTVPSQSGDPVRLHTVGVFDPTGIYAEASGRLPSE